ncbi:MAG: LEA type 2 family protein [Crocinitomicaceae bacterium]|nr:LEA type 2 family protein [Crocinitomicaceae bacterium]
MKYIVAIGLVVSLLASCTFHEPEIRGGETFKMEKMEGQEVRFTAGAKVYNGNWFAVKVKKSTLDLYVDGEYMGKVHLLKKVKMKAKKETDLQANFLAELEGNAMMKALGLAMKGEVEVRMKGKIKGGVFIFSKKLDFDEKRKINGSSLRGK